MRLSRRPARWLCTGLIGLLLLLQWATVAHACAMPAAPGHGSPAALAAGTAAMPGMPGCHGPAADPAVVCQAHCSQGQQTVQAGPAADPAAPALLLHAVLLDWSAATRLRPGACTARVSPVQSGAPPAGAPPRYLVLGVLRN
jgi:hypothetical protein